MKADIFRAIYIFKAEIKVIENIINRNYNLLFYSSIYCNNYLFNA